MGKPEALQFGRKEPGLDYLDRPTAFGIAIKDGKLAVVRVARPAGDYYDLPGGAIDAGESEAQALAREFREETGLKVKPLQAFARAGQYMIKSDGRVLNNLCAFWTVEIEGFDPALKQEDDHTLVWLEPEQAMAELRHDAYAWAVLAWTRLGRNGRSA